MIKAGQIWLIDHGAALDFHHDWRRVTEQAPREAGRFVAEHLLQVTARELEFADGELAPKLNREVLEQALAQVPEEFMAQLGDEAPSRQRAAYVAYLIKRLQSPRPFIAAGKNVPFQFGR